MRWSKYLLIITTIVYVSGNIAVSHAQETGEWYEKKHPIGPIRIGLYRADPDVPLIETLDIHELVASVFPDDYISERSRPSTYFYIFEYRYGEEYGEHAQFRIECGVYPSVRIAEEAALDQLLLDNSFWIKYGASDGETIGDNSWYNPDDIRFSAVVYKNLYFFLVFPISDFPQSGFESAEYYTRALVEQIKDGADFVTIKDTIAVPEISITSSKQALALGESCTITVMANDPLNRPLRLGGKDPIQNGYAFSFVQSDPEPTVFKRWVVAGDCVYSAIDSVTIGF